MRRFFCLLTILSVLMLSVGCGSSDDGQVPADPDPPPAGNPTVAPPPPAGEAE